MTLRDDLLTPFAGSHPGGTDLRYQSVYSDIKEARRRDDGLPKGAWREPGQAKTADHRRVIRLCEDALATASKDLQIAAWLTEALLEETGFGGLRQGLAVCHGLLANFWDSLYPPLEDGDPELRVGPLEWLDEKLVHTCRTVPLTDDGHDWRQFKQSREVPPEGAKGENEKKAREKAIKEGKITPEQFDRSFAQTSKAFYAGVLADIQNCLRAVDDLDAVCKEKFGDNAPTMGKLRAALEPIFEQTQVFLDKKREQDPDTEPVAAAAIPTAPWPELPQPLFPQEQAAAAAAPALDRVEAVLPAVRAEPADGREALAAAAAAAAFLRRREPLSPAPYLMMRGLRWGELRAAAAASDPAMLEAPPPELRVAIKKLALKRRWKELLETAETAMALPCSRAWLDLQRAVVEACQALGDEYRPIAQAVCSEIRTLLLDIPELLEATLMDDTPAANDETRSWARALLAHPEAAWSGNGRPSAWQKRTADAHDQATEAYAGGQPQRALEILYEDLQRQRSGRGRFRRTLQMAELCVLSGKEDVAQPLLDDIADALEKHKLEDWEDRELVCSALLMLMKSSKKIQGDAKEKQKLFERVCRLNPLQALSF
jgi:type VI secretion system protein ImpA